MITPQSPWDTAHTAPGALPVGGCVVAPEGAPGGEGCRGAGHGLWRRRRRISRARRGWQRSFSVSQAPRGRRGTRPPRPRRGHRPSPMFGMGRSARPASTRPAGVAESRPDSASESARADRAAPSPGAALLQTSGRACGERAATAAAARLATPPRPAVDRCAAADGSAAGGVGALAIGWLRRSAYRGRRPACRG